MPLLQVSGSRKRAGGAGSAGNGGHCTVARFVFVPQSISRVAGYAVVRKEGRTVFLAFKLGATCALLGVESLMIPSYFLLIHSLLTYPTQSDQHILQYTLHFVLLPILLILELLHPSFNLPSHPNPFLSSLFFHFRSPSASFWPSEHPRTTNLRSNCPRLSR